MNHRLQTLTKYGQSSPMERAAAWMDRPRESRSTKGDLQGDDLRRQITLVRNLCKFERINLCHAVREVKIRKERCDFYQEELTRLEKLVTPVTLCPTPKKADEVREYQKKLAGMTLDDILEEIVGEYTTDPTELYRDVQRAPDGSFVVQGSANVRELNRTMAWRLPTEGPKTINGLILEQLGTIPDAGVKLTIAGYPMEILQAAGNAIKSVRVRPAPSGGGARSAVAAP